MEVKINKEIRNYTESMFFGLSLRQFIFSVLACGVAVGLYFLLRPRFGTETLSWVCILGAFPFAAMGFIKYNGMTAEQFVWAWIKSEFIVLPLEKPCNIRRFRLSNPQTACTFPCFFPYGLKQGKDFYSPLTTLSSSRAELRFASLVEWA